MTNADSHNHSSMKQNKKSIRLGQYKPLFIIIALIMLASLTALLSSNVEFGSTEFLTSLMAGFMAGFFLVFSGFKLIDVSGFAEGYKKYDLLAKRIPFYGKVYPFLELGLGLGYLITPQNLWLNIATIVLLGFSAVGVISALKKGLDLRCSCLGTALSIPLSTVTVVEDIGMVAMALVMIAIG